jgi:hypothetical protein
MAVWDQGGIDKLRVLAVLLALVGLSAAYFWLAWHWSYSTGERAGWVRTLSRKGSICKTWEGEMAMVSMPGTATEKFMFTVWDDNVAAEISKVMGKRVSLHYEEKKGIPTTCFGDTRHYVTKVTAMEDFPLAPGINVPQQTGTPAAPENPPAPEKK